MPPTRPWSLAWLWPSTKNRCRQCWLRLIAQSPRTPYTPRLTKDWASQDNRTCKCANSPCSLIMFPSILCWTIVLSSLPWLHEVQMSHHIIIRWSPMRCSMRWGMKHRWCPNSIARITSYSGTFSLAFDWIAMAITSLGGESNLNVPIGYGAIMMR